MNRLRRKRLLASRLIAIIVPAGTATLLALRGERPPRPRPEASLFYQSKVDGAGHTRVSCNST